MINTKGYTKCPRCGCDEFVIKERVSGVLEHRYRFDGEESDNSDLYEGLTYGYSNKYAYCFMCEKKLFKLDD